MSCLPIEQNKETNIDCRPSAVGLWPKFGKENKRQDEIVSLYNGYKEWSIKWRLLMLNKGLNVRHELLKYEFKEDHVFQENVRMQ